jgi:hypothetical protein
MKPVSNKTIEQGITGDKQPGMAMGATSDGGLRR